MTLRSLLLASSKESHNGYSYDNDKNKICQQKVIRIQRLKIKCNTCVYVGSLFVPIRIFFFSSKVLSCKDLTPKRELAVRDAQWHDENLVAYVTHAGQLQIIDTRTYHVVGIHIHFLISHVLCVVTIFFNSVFVDIFFYLTKLFLC